LTHNVKLSFAPRGGLKSLAPALRFFKKEVATLGLTLLGRWPDQSETHRCCALQDKKQKNHLAAIDGVGLKADGTPSPEKVSA